MNNYRPSSQAEEQKQLATKEVITTIRSMTEQIKAALPEFLKKNTDRFVRIIMTEVRKNPKLVECTRDSFFGAVVQAAQLGLEVGSGLGQAYLVPFSNKGKLEVQLITGYQGMIELAERTKLVTVDAHVIYEKDKFRFAHGVHDILEHEPYFGKEDRGALIGAYAIAKYVDGRYKFRVLGVFEIEKARAMSKTKYNSIWDSHYDEMAQKTAIRRLFKLLPKSPEILRVQQLETNIELGESQKLDAIMKATDSIDVEIGGVVESEEGISLEEQEALTEQPK